MNTFDATSSRVTRDDVIRKFQYIDRLCLVRTHNVDALNVISCILANAKALLCLNLDESIEIDVCVKSVD